MGLPPERQRPLSPLHPERRGAERSQRDGQERFRPRAAGFQLACHQRRDPRAYAQDGGIFHLPGELPRELRGGPDGHGPVHLHPLGGRGDGEQDPRRRRGHPASAHPHPPEEHGLLEDLPRRLGGVHHESCRPQAGRYGQHPHPCPADRGAGAGRGPLLRP